MKTYKIICLTDGYHAARYPGFSRDGLRPATESEKSEILRALKWCRENFSKRLDTYLKRWGTGKLRFGTYWADR